MSIFIVLDILLILMIGIFIPIGYVRGPIRELFVTLGILFGILLADFWARPWGRDLADVTDLTPSSGGFVMAFVFLVASAFILGYGVGATLGNLWHTTEAKVLGGAIAALNGMLLLSFSLQYVRLFLLSDANEENLHDSFVADFLLDEIGWVLLGAAFFAVPLLLWILITGRRAYGYDEGYGYEYEDYDLAPPSATSRAERTMEVRGRQQALPPRVPVARNPAREHDADPTYKSEPPPRRRSPQSASRPLIVSEPVVTAEPAVPDDTPSERMSDTDPHIVLPISGDPPGDAPVPADSAASPTVSPDAEPRADELPQGFSRCVNCHAVLGPDTTICPNCGTLR